MTTQSKQLSTIQRTLHAPKSQTNTFGKYKYRSCEDILEAVKPLLGESTLTITDNIIEVGGRIYVKATATFHDGTNPVSVSACAREALERKGMDDSQITGSASSYARKYALNGLFCIDDSKDADATNDHGKPEPKPQPKVEPITPEQIASINDLAKRAGFDDARLAKGIEWASGKATSKLEALNKAQATKLAEKLAIQAAEAAKQKEGK